VEGLPHPDVLQRWAVQVDAHAEGAEGRPDDDGHPGSPPQLVHAPGRDSVGDLRLAAPEKGDTGGWIRDGAEHDPVEAGAPVPVPAVPRQVEPGPKVPAVDSVRSRPHGVQPVLRPPSLYGGRA